MFHLLCSSVSSLADELYLRKNLNESDITNTQRWGHYWEDQRNQITLVHFLSRHTCRHTRSPLILSVVLPLTSKNTYLAIIGIEGLFVFLQIWCKCHVILFIQVISILIFHPWYFKIAFYRNTLVLQSVFQHVNSPLVDWVYTHSHTQTKILGYIVLLSHFHIMLFLETKT